MTNIVDNGTNNTVIDGYTGVSPGKVVKDVIPAITSPTITGTVAGGATYTSPIINTPTIASPTITGTVAGGATYTSPIINTPTIASPTITGTVAGGATYSSITLTGTTINTGASITGGTITSPTITNPTITGTVGGTASYTSITATNPTITGTVGGTASYTSITATNPTITGTVGGTATFNGITINNPSIAGTITGGATYNSITLSGGTANSITINSPTINNGVATSITINSATINSPSIGSATINSSTINSPTINNGSVNSATLASNTLSGTTTNSGTINGGNLLNISSMTGSANMHIDSAEGNHIYLNYYRTSPWTRIYGSGLAMQDRPLYFRDAGDNNHVLIMNNRGGGGVHAPKATTYNDLSGTQLDGPYLGGNAGLTLGVRGEFDSNRHSAKISMDLGYITLWGRYQSGYDKRIDFDGATLSQKTYVGTTDWFFSGGSYSLPSDRRIKSNISELTNSLNIVENIPAVSFKRKTSSREDPVLRVPSSAKFEYGFIAQDVEALLPMAIESGGEYPSLSEDKPAFELKMINMNYLLPILWGAVKELNTKVKDLEARITQLENN
jgi:hypothetical protein